MPARNFYRGDGVFRPSFLRVPPLMSPPVLAGGEVSIPRLLAIKISLVRLSGFRGRASRPYFYMVAAANSVAPLPQTCGRRSCFLGGKTPPYPLLDRPTVPASGSPDPLRGAGGRSKTGKHGRSPGRGGGGVPPPLTKASPSSVRCWGKKIKKIPCLCAL